MTLSTKVGAFNLTAGAATTTIAVTGVGFVPKVLLFWWGGNTSSTDAASGIDLARGFGVATSTTSRWAVSSQSETAQTSSDTDRIHRNDACIATMTIAGGVDCLMDLQSFDADGFTLVVDDASVPLRRIHYLALGGTDITNATTGQFDEAAATGTQDITGVGFRPDFVMFGSVGLTTDPPTLSTSAVTMIGAATAAQEAVLFNVALNNVSTMDTSAYCRTGECVVFGTSAGMTKRAEFSTFQSDGFQLNWLERSADMVVSYLAIKGGQYRLDEFLTSTSNGATITETGFGFAPKATMLFSHGRAADTQDVITDSDQWNVGAFTSTTERGAQGTLDEDNVGDSDNEAYVEHDAALAQWTTAPAVVGLVDVQSIDADGFTLVMDSAANPAAFVWYLSFGDGPAIVTPAAIAVTVTLPTPTIAIPAQVAPAVIPVTVSLPTPTILISAIVTPAVIPVVVALPTPTVQAAATVTPAVIPVTVSLPTPITVVSATVNPAVIAVTVSLPTPTVLAAAKVLPAVIPVTLTLPTPTVIGGAIGVVTPATIAATVSLPTPAISVDAVVTPAGITLVVTLPTPGVTTPGLVTPAGISVVVTVPTPLATVGAITFWTPNPVLYDPIGAGDEPPWN